MFNPIPITRALAEFGRSSGVNYAEEGNDELLLDVLVDLMHWAKAHDVNFDQRLDIARKCFADERETEFEIDERNHLVIRVGRNDYRTWTRPEDVQDFRDALAGQDAYCKGYRAALDVLGAPQLDEKDLEQEKVADLCRDWFENRAGGE